MYNREEITPEFYDKLSESEKRELVQIILEDRLTDFLHIKGLPNPVQNCIKSAVKSSAEDMKEETIAGYPVEWVKGIKSVDDDIVTGATQNFKPNQEFDRLQQIVNECVSNRQYTEDSILDVINEDYFKSEDNYLMKPREVDPKRLLISNVCSRRGWDMPYPIMMESDIRRMREDVVKPVTKEIFDKLVSRGTNVYDRNGRMFLLDSMPGFTPDKLYIHYPRSNSKVYKSWLWLNELIRAMSYPPQSYSIDEFPIYPKPITTVQLKSVIFWDAGDQDYLSNLKARDSRFKQLWMDENVRNYHFNDSPIADMALDLLATLGPDINSAYGMSTPNLNNIEKKKLERVIKRRKKK